MGLVFSLAAKDYFSLVGKTFWLAHSNNSKNQTLK